ncbi:hypothetical protein [Acidisphaera sp. L21]|uniref:hypothetical protein n=1 Tax=Acidisphaera sp. L21 TaxID=1641851 RepID=UPI00131E390E|nr:hypothetical protein [Acidisphaera sp. L21]
MTPSLDRISINHMLILPTLTKYLAGSTALVGFLSEMAKQGHVSAASMNSSVGFLLHPLDVPGLAILISPGIQLGRNCLPAIAGACVGIALRSAGSALLS